MTPEQFATVLSAGAALIGAVAAVASAVFAGVAVRAQRRAGKPSVRVTGTTLVPVYGGFGPSLAGSRLGDAWYGIIVHNDGLRSVTVRSVGLAFSDGGSAPFIRAPWAGADSTPKLLEPGDEATFYLDDMRKIGKAHAEHGGARWPTATVGGGTEFHGRRVDKKVMDSWAKAWDRDFGGGGGP